MKRRHTLILVALATLFAGCTGDSDSSDPTTTAVDTTTTATSAAPTTTTTIALPAIDLVAFNDYLFGPTGVAPEGWTAVDYGVLFRGEPSADPTFLVQQAAPSASAREVLDGLVAQLELGDRPPAGNAVTTDHLTWTIYEFETDAAILGGQLLQATVAIAESDWGGFIVGLGTPPDEHDVLRATVFEPALEAYAPPAQPVAPDPSALYRDASAETEARVEDLLARMTIREKIGQMTQVEKNSLQEGAITLFGIGSVLSGGGGSPVVNTPAGWAEMVRGFQEEALATRLGIPLIYGVDAVHGHNNVKGATVFPHNVGLGAANDPDLMRRIGAATAALEVAATGIQWNFAPTVAVPQDIRWGRTYEGFGERPDLVTPLAAAYLEGLQGDDLAAATTVLATPKHFIGDGGTSYGSATTGAGRLDQGVTEVDEETLRSVHLPPYIEAIDRGAESVMISYSSWNDTKVHASEYLISDVLKTELGFDGLVLSDWQAIDQISPDYYTAVVAAFNAGIDMNMVPYNYGRFIWTLGQAIDTGDVTMDRIDDAVRRILRVKFALGLFESPHPDPALLDTVGSPDHRAVAREAVAKSAVLLKNEGALPIEPNAGVIFVGGQAADNVGIQSGGWTIEWQGQTGAITPGTTILEGIEAAAGDGSEVYYDRFGNLDRLDVEIDPDLCIGVVGERPYAEFEGDSEDLVIDPQDFGVLENLEARCERLVIVLVSGRPLIITDHLDAWDAVVAAWLPGTEGDGIADVLFGVEPFQGKLPYTWPRSIDQVPLSALVTSGEEPLFPFGFGLG